MGYTGGLPMGVHWTCRTDRGRPYWYCVASVWNPVSGKQEQKWFAVQKYGEDEALEKAIKAREKMLNEIYGEDNEA